MSKRSRSASAWGLGILFLSALQASAGVPSPPRADVAYSSSGQFIVKSPSVAGFTRRFEASTNSHPIRLETSFVAVSCERIRQYLNRELQIEEGWHGKIYVILHPARAADERAAIFSERFADGWQYRVELPTPIDRTWYVRAIVQAVLQEFANRTTAELPAQVPVWLIEGLSQRLITQYGTEIILTPSEGLISTHRPGSQLSGPWESLKFTSVARKENPLEELHGYFSQHTPLTFDELCWPDSEQFEGDTGRLYACSAHLFVNELVNMQDGRARLNLMLSRLPIYLNWQLPFLEAFQGVFERPRDVEKWWSLQTLHFTGHQLSQTWSPEESWKRLSEVIQSAVEIRTETGELPLRADISLQTVLGKWTATQQSEALAAKIREIDSIHIWLAPKLAEVAQDYRKLLASFLESRDRGLLGLPFGREAELRRLTEETVQRLNELDARREALRPGAAPASTNTPPTIPSPGPAAPAAPPGPTPPPGPSAPPLPPPPSVPPGPARPPGPSLPPGPGLPPGPTAPSPILPPGPPTGQ